jgi:hypothetical protein
MPHKFKVGDAVTPKLANRQSIPAGTYQVTRLLPEIDGEFGYRIKHPAESYERTGLEGGLTEAPPPQSILPAAPTVTCGGDTKGQDSGGRDRAEKPSDAQQRGKKSRLPPRVPNTTGKLPNLELPRSCNRFCGYTDFLDSEVKMVLLQSGWSPPLASISGDAFDKRGSELVVCDKLTGGNVDPAVERDIFAAVISEHNVSRQLWWAVREYQMAVEYAVDPKQFRSDLNALDETLDQLLLVKMPESDSALGVAVDQALQEIIPSVELLDTTDSQAMDFDFDSLKFDFDNLKPRFEALSQAVKKIRSIEQGKGADAERAKHQFIADLGQIFTECTGKALRNEGSRKGVTRPFGSFVKALARQLPERYQLTDIDNLIRHEISRRAH